MYGATTSDDTYREEEGRLIRGVFLHVVINGGTYVSPSPMYSYVTDTIKIYEDGLIDCWGLTDLEGFRQKVRKALVVTTVPEGARVLLREAGIHLTATQVDMTVEPEDFLVQVEDELHTLRGERTTHSLCVEAFEAYEQDPTEAARKRLHDAYQAVPKHLREWLVAPSDRQRYIDDEIRQSLGLPED